MIVKKLAISPISPIRASSDAPTPSPKTALNPSNNGVADVPIAAAPPPIRCSGTGSDAKNIRVVSPQIVARGMSRFGSCDSSAASGSSSIAR